ncbi:MAG: hypothetical protein V4723_04930, partial [Pseudomonadota bacterium]
RMKTMKWLLKRELWEHKGALVWAPVVAAALMLVIITATMFWGLAQGGFHGDVDFNGHASIGAAFASIPAAHKAQVVATIAGSYMMLSGPLFAMMAIIALFYCIASMYEERRDRSILFWKSLPVSDTETVMSKLITATVVAPLITIAAAAVFSLALVIILGITLAINGVNVIGPVLSSGQFYLLPLQVLALLPIFALWALPTVGWLMLVSAWAKSKAFLWAFGIPVALVAVLAWLNYMLGARIDMDWVSTNIFARGLGSLFPGSWFMAVPLEPAQFIDESRQLVSTSVIVSKSWSVLSHPQLWGGALAGAAMIFGAIRLRRWRDEG